MNVKTMEGLAGAGASISMITTPMNVAKEAECKGDTDKMQRALSYAAGVKDQAEAYQEKASQGMKIDAKEAKKQEEVQQKKLIESRREEREEQAKQTEAKTQTRDSEFDSVEISQEGADLANSSGQAPISSMDGVPDVVYDMSGEVVEAAQETGQKVDVVV